MKDLLLWKTLLDLRDGSADLDALVELLSSASALHVRQRFPFFGLVTPLLEHEDARLRAGALDLLRGADGLPAFRAIVGALGDPEASVRLAAVEALRASAVGHPARWAHAVFHADVGVRRHAIGGPAPQSADGYALHLLADPACHASLLARLEAGELTVPPRSLVAVLELVARRVLPRRTGRALLAHVPWDEALAWLAASRRRSDDAVASALAAEAGEVDGAAGEDGFDDLFDLFWDEPEGDEPSRPAEAFYNRLSTAMLGWTPDVARRAQASLVVVARRRGGWCSGAARTCAVFHPRFLAMPSVPRHVRRAAVAALYDAGAQVPRIDDEDVKALVLSEIARRPEGSLDLWVIGGLLHLARSTPYRLLRRWVGTEAVLAAFAEEVESSVAFLCLKDDSRRGRKDLLERICKARPHEAGLVLALLALAAPIDGLDFLEEMDGDQAARVLCELLRVTERPGVGLPARKVTRVAHVFADRIAPDWVGTFFRAWLDRSAPEESPLGLATLGAIGASMEVTRFVDVALELEPLLLRRLLVALSSCAAFPFGKELLLARPLVEHPDEIVASWARARVPPEGDTEPRPRAPAGAPVPALTHADASAIATSRDADLPAALAPCLTAPSAGLTRALALRPAPSAPVASACVALLGAHDPLDEVDAELARFMGEGNAFLSELDARAVRAWEREPNLPLLGHAWIHRWERHAFAAVDALLAEGGELALGLARIAGLRTAVMRTSVWEATASVLAMWRWRARPRLLEAATPALVDVLVEGLASERGEAAARSLVVLHEAGAATEALAARRATVTALLPDLDDATRDELRRWVASSGLTGRTAPRRRPPKEPDAEILARVRGATDLDALAGWCRDTSSRVVEEATLRLIDLGPPGLERLAALLAEDLPPQGVQAIVDSVALWPTGPWIASVERLARASGLPDDLRFRLAVALFERGDRTHLETALEVARRDLPPGGAWFRPEDWDRLIRLGATALELALGLARSPQPHAYRRAVEHLLTDAGATATEAAAVRGFLETGTARISELRHRAGRWLLQRGDASAFPLALAEALERDKPDYGLLAGVDPVLVHATVGAILVAGPRVIPELTAYWMAQHEGVDRMARAECLERIVIDGLSDTVRAKVVGELEHSRARPIKLRAVAETFAWGVRMARELTGRIFTVQMVKGRGLGYTRLAENRVYVSPLPILRREPHGRALVEALILHELGHHLHHRGEEQQEIWEAAQKEGIHGLLNLVADEHLERNLRALDPAFGDRLKRLAAYAFAHADREIDVQELLQALGGRAFEILSGAPLGVARREGCVAVRSGELLQVMERSGLSFPRFVRALRMGLGGRHADPEVDAALALFRRGFRRRSMADLLETARALRAMFGWQARLVETFGSHETMPTGESEQIEAGEGITSEEIDEEIERVLDPKKRRRGEAGRRDAKPGKRWINVSGDEKFETIHRIVKVPFDPAEHARYASRVARHSRQMRRYLERLGLALEPQRLRLRGRLDPTRMRALVLRGDPRMLISRERQIKTDLFLGVLIDCSGSMRSSDHIQTAKLFGAMLAEAARALPGVDLRVFGYTDDVIYDAGDAARCAAHALEAEGGNNDAAALWHAALAARASERRAKLLVMVSDGLPTECSAAALRALVTRLTRRMHVSCAQVAVRPLAEICFPDYIVLEVDDQDVAVRRFGAIVARLVQRAMAR